MEASGRKEGEDDGVKFLTSTRVVGFERENDDKNISKIICRNVDTNEETVLSADTVVFAVGGAALNAMVRYRLWTGSCRSNSKWVFASSVIKTKRHRWTAGWRVISRRKMPKMN